MPCKNWSFRVSPDENQSPTSLRIGASKVIVWVIVPNDYPLPKKHLHLLAGKALPLAFRKMTIWSFDCVLSPSATHCCSGFGASHRGAPKFLPHKIAHGRMAGETKSQDTNRKMVYQVGHFSIFKITVISCGQNTQPIIVLELAARGYVPISSPFRIEMSFFAIQSEFFHQPIGTRENRISPP